MSPITEAISMVHSAQKEGDMGIVVCEDMDIDSNENIHMIRTL